MEDEQSYQQVLELTRANALAKAKRTARNNQAIIILLLILSVAVGYAVYSYARLNEAKAQIAKNNADLKTANDQLAKSEAALQQNKKVLDSVVKSVRSTNARQDTLIAMVASRPSEAKAILAPIIKDREAARNYSRQGYTLLKDGNLQDALKAFQASEKSYNGYRDSYEVYYLLSKNKDHLNDPVVKKRLQTQIYSQYNSLKILQSTDIK